MSPTKLTRQDLQIYPTERLNDSQDGGGLMLKSALSGEDNELFPPVSDMARTMGAFSARSVHGAVRVAVNEPLLGAHMILSEPRQAPNVSYLLFKGGRYGELRGEAIKRIEAYSVATIQSRMTLFGVQTQGSRIVQTYQRVEEPVPLVGDVYALRQDERAQARLEQYIQVIRVQSEKRTFTDEGGEFERLVVKMEISAPLNHDFQGANYPSRRGGNALCGVLETHVADSANYYGVKPLSKALTKGEMKCQVTAIMEKLVPTARSETPLIDSTLSGQHQSFTEGQTATTHILVNSNQSALLGTSVVAGSFKLGDITDRNGTLYQANQAVGTIDYRTGEIRSQEYLAGDASFKVAAPFSAVQETMSEEISVNNRRLNYVYTLDPVPALGTAVVYYRAQNRWYTLKDAGDGKLQGASPQFGGGFVDKTTGNVSITLGELPDIGSAVVVSWGNGATAKEQSALVKPRHYQAYELKQAIVPNSLSITGAGFSGSYQDDGAGIIKHNGTAVGKVNYQSGRVELESISTLDHVFNLQGGEALKQSFKAPLRGHDGKITLPLNHQQITPRTLKLVYNLLIDDYEPITFEETVPNIITRPVDPYKILRDDGAGKLVDETGKEYGTIDYSTGSLQFLPETTVSIPKGVYKNVELGRRLEPNQIGGQDLKITYRRLFSHYEYIEAGARMPIDESALVEVEYYSNQSPTARQETLPAPDVTVDLLGLPSGSLAPSSVSFNYDGWLVSDMDGRMVARYEQRLERLPPIDYQAKRLTLPLTLWRGGSIEMRSLAQVFDAKGADSITFLLPTAPIAPQSLNFTVSALNGKVIRVTCNAKGELQSSGTIGVSGKVDFETGYVHVRFGAKVSATGHESASWFDARAVENGQVWKPEFVYPQTLRYNAVAIGYLPLDTSVLGIDAARLPLDGRVPIFRRGDMIVIAKKTVKDLGNSHTSDGVVDLGMAELDDVLLFDKNGKALLSKHYSVNLKTGQLVWQSALDLSDYVQPISAHLLQEEENRVMQVDIDGTLTLQFPVSRDYPEGSYVSSALLAGDLIARTSPPFTQKTWTNEWSNQRIGDSITSQLNVKDFPITLTNDGATTDRWALVFKTATEFEVYSEALGYVGRFDVLTDLAPINPSTDKPYFTLPRGAFTATSGRSPWAVGNTIRFNTFGVHIGVWVLRAVQPSSQKSTQRDGFALALRGNTVEI